MMQNIVGAFISFYLRYIVAKYSTALKTEIVVGLSTDRCTYLRCWVCDRRAIGTLVSGDPHRWNHFLVLSNFVDVLIEYQLSITSVVC